MAKILLADDSAFMRKVLSDILAKNGFTELTEAENGTQAIEKYDAGKPDLVLLDVIMPETDGIAVLKNIVPKGASAIIISAVGQDDMINQAKEAGAKGYIVKPFDEAQVMTEVKKIIEGGGDQAQVDAPAAEAPAQTVPVQDAPAAPAPAPVAPVATSSAQDAAPSAGTAPAADAPSSNEQPAAAPETAAPAETPKQPEQPVS